MQPTIFIDVHQFWFGPIPEFQSFNPDRLSLWFGGSRDAEIADRYSAALGEVQTAAINTAVLSPMQQVGLVILLDQFPRNIFRGHPRSYAFDEQAREVVEVATNGGMGKFKLIERAFLTICLGHSERLEDQERTLQHYRNDISAYAPAGNRFYEAGGIQTAKYVDIIRRFGRFPHRNGILGRETRAEEEGFLAENTMAPF